MNSLNTLWLLLKNESAVLVNVISAQGSVPRGVGTWMVIAQNQMVATIGGGHLEHEAIRIAKQMLVQKTIQTQKRFSLGPSLGQCCGGEVELSFECINASDIERLKKDLAPSLQPLALFGGGHVGQALIRVLADLPFAITWIDSRDEIFPSDIPPSVVCEHSHPIQSAVKDLNPNTWVLMMSFSHAEDLDILQACLMRARAHNDLPYIGLIGSQTKWATFRHRLEAKGFAEDDFAKVICPIGISTITGKEPEVIAVSVAAQLLALRATH